MSKDSLSVSCLLEISENITEETVTKKSQCSVCIFSRLHFVGAVVNAVIVMFNTGFQILMANSIQWDGVGHGTHTVFRVRPAGNSGPRASLVELGIMVTMAAPLE